MPRKPKPIKILLNALHTNGGGGLVYLQGILPHLAADTRLEWQLLLMPEVVQKLTIPANIKIRLAPHLKFGVSHAWEQLVLPILARVWGCRLVLSNANYGPLLAPRASVILHTTPRAAACWLGIYWQWYWWALRHLTRLSVWRAPLFFSVAAHIVPDYAGPRVAKKLVLAPPAMDPHALPAAPTRDPNLVLAVGDFYPQKNYPLLLQAFAKLRQVHAPARLMIVGRPVQTQVRDEVLQLARELKILDALTLIPGVPHRRLMEVMGQATVYVSTSSAEAFNMPVLEAMASGTPVVVFDTPFQREVAGADAQAAAVFVPPAGADVPAALAIALLGVLSNPTLAATLSKRGHQRAAGFSWQKTGQALTNALAKHLKV